MVVGGADLAATFIEHGLVDELHLFVNPVVLGRGNRLFPETKIDFKLVGTRTFGNGVVLLRYRR
jgi:dihydrofolate reductase